MNHSELLTTTAQRAIDYLGTLDDRRVAPTTSAIVDLKRFDLPLPNQPTAPSEVVALLDAVGSPATSATAGPRYFGFVTGGVLPAALAASWLATAWDNNAGLSIMSPIAAKLEEVALQWLIELLGFPATTGAGFVTGATMANFTGLVAARHVLLQRQGWDVAAQGLFGAPPLTVVVGDEVHASVLKALSLVGFGRERVVRVPVDGQGRMRADALPKLDARTLLCLQMGNVNSGACDPAAEICAVARQAGAWVHVDGAFGLWAAAAPDRAHLVAGMADADSWATDAHKWLNVSYDSGIVFVRDRDHLRNALVSSAAYLVDGEMRDPYQYTPEMSRRARGVEVWAVLQSLGRAGLADLIERNCQYATRFAEGLRAAGYAILNEVVLNQVMVSFGDDARTRAVIAGVQAEGTCWCGGTVWHGRAAMRISVSSWATTPADVERSLAAIIQVAHSLA